MIHQLTPVAEFAKIPMTFSYYTANAPNLPNRRLRILPRLPIQNANLRRIHVNIV